MEPFSGNFLGISFFIFFFLFQYRIPIFSFVLRGWRVGGLAVAKSGTLVFFYLFQYRIPDLFFVLRGRRTEGVADANPLCELPRLLRLLLGLVFAYGSFGC